MDPLVTQGSSASIPKTIRPLMRFLRRVLVLRRLLFRLLRQRPRLLGLLLRCRRELMQGFAFCNKGIGLRLGCNGLRFGLFGNGCHSKRRLLPTQTPPAPFGLLLLLFAVAS